MKLPEVKTPKYSLNLISNSETVYFRPMFIKEQKVILSAVEMKDSDQLNNAIEDVLTATTFNEVDINKLPIYDIEYLLLNIRAKSIGEEVELSYICNNKLEDDSICKTKNLLSINLTDIKIIKPERLSVIKLFDDVGIKMRDLTYSQYKEYVGKDKKKISLDVIAMCVDSIFDGDAVYSSDALKHEEIVEFIGKLIPTDFDKIEDYTNNMPRLELTKTIKCRKCGAEEKIKLSGLDDFLE